MVQVGNVEIGEVRQVALALGALDANAAAVSKDNPIPVTDTGSGYERIAASSTDAVLGLDGAPGDVLAGLLIIPTSKSPGAVSIHP